MDATRLDILATARAAYEAHRTHHPIPSCRPGGSRELPTWEDATEELRQSWIDDVSRPRYFAALGTDGRRPVVWGVGRTEEEATEDAAEWLEGRLPTEDGSDLRIVEINAERYARIEGGEMDASDLWSAA